MPLANDFNENQLRKMFENLPNWSLQKRQQFLTDAESQWERYVALLAMQIRNKNRLMNSTLDSYKHVLDYVEWASDIPPFMQIPGNENYLNRQVKVCNLLLQEGLRMVKNFQKEIRERQEKIELVKRRIQLITELKFEIQQKVKKLLPL